MKSERNQKLHSIGKGRGGAMPRSRNEPFPITRLSFASGLPGRQSEKEKQCTWRSCGQMKVREHIYSQGGTGVPNPSTEF